MYAVIKTGGKQHRVSAGETLNVEKISGNKGEEIVFNEVLMIADEGNISVGKPILEGAKVVGEIITQTKGHKINVFRMKKRKGYHKKTGHRQQLTSLKIKEISI